MTGPERQTLAGLFELVGYIRTDMKEVKDDVKELGQKVEKLELQDARKEGAAEGQQAAVAHANVVNQRIEGKAASRRDSIRTVVAVAVGAATIAGTLVGIVVKFL